MTHSFSARKAAKRLFPWASEGLGGPVVVGGPVVEAGLALLTEIFRQGGERAAKAFETLLRRALPSPSIRGGTLAADGPSVDPNRFGLEVVNALEQCRLAARYEHGALAYIGVSSRRTLPQLSRQLKTLADQVRRINESIFGSPVRAFDGALKALDPDEIDATIESYKRRLDLPETLEDYADSLKTLRGKWRDLVRDQEMSFLDLVTKRTGKPHFREVCDLLAATYAVAGLGSRDVSEKVLALRRDRYTKSGKVPARLPSVPF